MSKILYVKIRSGSTIGSSISVVMYISAGKSGGTIACYGSC